MEVTGGKEGRILVVEVMGFETFTVALEPHKPVYFPGQVLRGVVRTYDSRALVCLNIIVYVKGKARVEWKERRSTHSQTYSADEKYFKFKCKVWVGAENNNEVPPGHHSFTFSVVLPQHLPSSFESSVGVVRYEIKAEADLPNHPTQSALTCFSVNGIYDLNNDPLSRNQMYGKDSFSTGQGPIHLVMGAERTGYAPGETIVLNGEVVNHSRYTVKYSEAKIVQKITYITINKIRSDTRTVQRVYRSQITPGGRDEWVHVPFPVPPVPSSHLQHCHIIKIDYHFVLVGKVDSRRVAKLEIPIIIGSIPLHGVLSTHQAEGGISMTPTNLTTPQIQLATPQPHFDALDMPQSQSGLLLLPGSQWRSDSPSVSRSTTTALLLPNTSGRFGSIPVRSRSSSLVPNTPPKSSDDPPSYSECMLPEEYKDVPPPSYASCFFSGGQTQSLGRRSTANVFPRQTTQEVQSPDGRFAPHYITYGIV
ncbi:hypothetical protein Pcinc_013037 [Petrolisthes cinctipes]|uniref:Arrestin C-terminal-like domain-containing protein n=1 Tax=Petrolisthes cinctipes TaxID=88211 RepID=A0AAE1FZP7_PETCI|nr:hypothetical protein Pcinc_013037 [Petrolisthes cinctipes]